MSELCWKNGGNSENPVRLSSVLANFGSAVTVHVGVTVHRYCSQIDRDNIGIKSDPNDDFSLNLW
ncbi:hypothetical protein SLEP1_g43736 [Rubroshorea leprosula]|uniref:Uncharacterized protein n=1 Tax=Rubroshorea leprosula TaxID=152421 RepID=A0AAV5LDZ2_9ROSI|nr:hypothetical protein SLEP1_g43736 [Rubroshorea leprosula]